MRRAILAAGDRLAAQERIEQPAHLLEARFEEAVSLVRDGEGPSAAELAEHARFRNTHNPADAPPQLGDEPPPPPPLDQLPEPAARAMRAAGTCVAMLFGNGDRQSERTVVRGLSASPGVYEGTARLLGHPGEVDRIVPGDVLVTGSTSEAFNLVLPLVGAIVTDNGGLLSHAAIVSREYGIPGVVGTRQATDLITDGARVRVDGDAGEVTVIA
jgi:pyruvate,water dikinase